MALEKINAHWRDTARPARFGPIDAKAVFPFLLFLLHMRLWTFCVAVVCIMFFGILERWGFTMPVFLRWLRASIAGPRRMAIPWWRKPKRIL